MIALLLIACGPLAVQPIHEAPGDTAVSSAVDADPDSDGFSTSEELDAGSDPQYRFSWDFGGERWPEFSDEADAAGFEGTGYALGEPLVNFVAVDQFDQEVSLDTFYGYVILLDFVAGWCGPCNQAAAEAQGQWEEQRLDGVLYVHVIVDDNVQDDVVEPGFATLWAETYDLEFPVLLEQDGATLQGLTDAGVYEGALPFTVLLDPQMQVDSSYTGAFDAAIARAATLTRN